MQTTRLSSKGQIIIPRAIREAHRWSIGQEFTVEETAEGLLLRPQTPLPFEATTLEQVAGCLAYDGPVVSLDQMDAAIARGVEEAWGDRR